MASGARRGVMTVQRSAAAAELIVPPEIRATRVRRGKPVPSDEVARFVTNQSMHHMVKIVKYSDDPKHIQDCADKAKAIHTNGYIPFVNFHYGTPFPFIAELIDYRVNNGQMRGVMRDVKTMLIGCPWCDHTETNTVDGHHKLIRHQMDNHQKEVYGVEFSSNLDAELEEATGV